MHQPRLWPLILLLLCGLLCGSGDTFAAPESKIETETGGLLLQAEQAEMDNHLLNPARGSAASLYHRILAMDPVNAAAVAGLERIAEGYLESAQQAIDAQNPLKADALVAKARMAYPDYSGIEPLVRQLTLLDSARRRKTSLDWRLVSDRSPTLIPDLKRIGAQARQAGCLATIQVSNDAEGRWVYAQMNRAPGERRIRAEIRIASPAGVEVVCFDDS